MRHLCAFRKLGRPTAERKALLRALTTSLIKYQKISTTVTRAKELRRFADQMVTLAKKGSKKENNQFERRLMGAWLYEKELVHKAFSQFPKQFKERNGGYTKIVRTGFRKGDGSPMCTIEYIDQDKI